VRPLCHSTVDNSFVPGIGKRLDGWANRDLNVGAIVSLAPSLKPLTDLLGVDADTVRKVLASWGPGRYDAELDKDGKALGATAMFPLAFPGAAVKSLIDLFRYQPALFPETSDVLLIV
jgi:hypothetical protein